MHCLSPISTNNMLTWDRVILIISLIVGLDIDFARWIQAEIHERAFQKFTILLFPSLVQTLCYAIGTILNVYQRM